MNVKNGFSFIELILVIALIGILGAMSMTFYGRFLFQSSLQNTIDGLVNQLRKAQIYSMEGRLAGSWGIHNGTTEFILFQGNSYATRNTSVDESFPMYASATVSGFTDIVFNRITGTPSASGVITIISGTTTKTITINSMGMVSR